MMADMHSKPQRALVIGATGVSGWSLCLQLLQTQTPSAFESVDLLTNRPVSLSDAQWPTDSRLRVHSGIDLNRTSEEVIGSFRGIPDIGEITHVFYVACGMSPTYDFAETAKINVQMTKAALDAIEAVAVCTKHISFQAGSIVYGIPFADWLGDNFRPGPFNESFARVPPPFSDMVSHYRQEDYVKAMADKNSWTWSSIRPDTIIGFTPRNSPHCLSVSLGLYFAFYRYVYGKGAVLHFPGSESAWKADFTVIGQDQLARFHIFTSTHAASNGTPGALNISNGETTSWEQIWPKIVQYFDLVGAPPEPKMAEGDSDDASSPRFGPEWFQGVTAKATEFEAEYGLQPDFVTNIAWQYLTFLLNLKIDRVLDIEKARDLGFLESSNTVSDFEKSWDHMRKARIIPSVEQSD